MDIVKYLATALDPIHIGTGGYRLGRVDNTIIRDFDNVPKIPATAIAGAIRSYAALYFEKRGCAGKDDITGKGGRQCGETNCPICVTFGYSKDTEARVSMVSFSDARILFFPVSTMIGPVWVTSPGRLNEFTNSQNYECGSDEELKVAENFQAPDGRINLGWVLFKVKKDHLTLSDAGFAQIPSVIKNNAICVTDRIFPLIINANLEVRTSVSIDPFTGAALEGALFTYEAVPRTTIFWFESIYQDYKNFGDAGGYISKVREKFPDVHDNAIKAAKAVVRTGMDWCEVLGIGGMNTRGFGRLRINVVNSGGK